MAEFQKIDAGQRPRFNWVALFFGPYLCFYRRCPALFKRYFLLSYILLFAAALVAAVGLALLNLTVLLACGVMILAAGVLTLVNSIRLGRNFNREYYHHCQQQLALPEPQRKNGEWCQYQKYFVVHSGAGTVVWVMRCLYDAFFNGSFS